MLITGRQLWWIQC
uniref:Uncharacterized protein n=1 Tax=Arundo donax TaxID=35708 RepID=A0A0A9G8K3_ARUDO